MALLAATGFLADVGQLLRVVQGVSPDGNVVPAKVSFAQPETLVPFALSVVVAFFYLQAIETVGSAVAAALRVGSGLNPTGLLKKRERFCNSWGEGVYFAIQLFVSFRLFSGTSWYWPSGWDQLLLGDGHGALPLYHCTREMRTYYLLEFGWYSMCLVVLFFKRRRSDFREMLAHHVITIMLIVASYFYGYLRVGVVVMNLHNMFDPFLHFAKCCHYAFKGSLHVLADVSFGLGVFVFLASRLVLYPVVTYKLWINLLAFPGAHPVWDATVDQLACKILLCMLYPIHLFWFYLILKVAKKALVGGKAQGDDRSDSEDEDKDKSSKKEE